MKINKKFVDSLDFNKMSNQIMNEFELKVGNKKFRICEIEYYVNNDKHKDTYTHGNEDQLKYETFYFHKYKTGTYKSGTYKGMDMTFGSPNSYFGVLIRAIYDEVNDEFIEGPCKTVNKILELNGAKEVSEMVNKDSKLDIYTYDKVSIVYNKDLIKKDVYAGTRIGLSDKYPEYKVKEYRHIIYNNKIKKEKSKLKKLQ